MTNRQPDRPAASGVAGRSRVEKPAQAVPAGVDLDGWLKRYLKSTKHGNFHFHSGDLITFKKQGKLLLRLHDLEFVHYLLVNQSRREGKDEDYYWRKFNGDIQKVIDDKVAELDPHNEE